MGRDDRRSPEAQAWRKLYKTRRWQATRANHLAANPLCVMCRAKGRITAATVCDHVDPNLKRNPATFFDGPFNSLCDDPRYRCHSSRKQQQERKGFSTDVGADGVPLDPAHPWHGR